MVLCLVACCAMDSDASPAPTSQSVPNEVRARPLRLDLPVEEQKRLEFSGLAWHGDRLILLPEKSDFVLAAARRDVVAALAGGGSPIPTTRLALRVADALPGFDGYESIAIEGNRAWVSVEVDHEGGSRAWLLEGRITETSLDLKLHAEGLMPSRAGLKNLSHEALAVGEQRLLALYEANGELARLQPLPEPRALSFTRQEAVRGIAFQGLEYRVTAATGIREGRFWVVNYQYFGDRALRTLADPLAARFGRGATHARSARDAETMIVERLVELRVDPSNDRVVWSGRPPIQIDLETLADGTEHPAKGCNWEGLARLDEPPGFLVIADEYAPAASTLVFVPAREEAP